MAEALDAGDIYELTRVTELAVAPHGERVAFVAHEYDPDADERRASLFVVPADGSEPAHRLTRASSGGSPTWSPDGRYLGFVAARETDTDLRVGPPEDTDEDDDEEEEDTDTAGGGDDEEPRPQVWAFDMERGGDARQLTDRDHGVRGFDFGPDGERIVVDARDPTDEEAAYLEEKREGGPIEVERLQHKADGVGWLDDVTAYLFVVDCASREETRLDDAYGRGSIEPLVGLQPAWGAGDRIAFLSNRTDDPDDSHVYDVYTIDPDGTDLQRVSDGDRWCMAPTWSPAGDRLACAARHPPSNWYRPAEAYVADPDAGTFASVSGELDRTVGLLSRPHWVADDTLLVPIGDEGRTRLTRCPVDGDGGPERVFDAQGTHRSVVATSGTDGGVAVAMAGADAPQDVYALDDDLAAATRLTDLNDEFVAEHPMPGYERIEFENGEGQAIEAHVFLPADFDPDGDPNPTVVAIHGGPMAYDTPAFQYKRALFAARGYVVLCVNYRGSSSYGRAFCESLRGSRGDLETEDVTSGVEALVDRGWADPDRLFVTGFSHGGIATAHVVTRDDRFAAAAPEHGIYDYQSNFGTDDNQVWMEDEFGLPWEEPETYREISSITDVGDIETPLLITAGEHDWRCPPTQAEQLYVSVKKRGVPAKLVVYQDEHHDVADPERAIHRLETLVDWFETHDPTVEDDAEG